MVESSLESASPLPAYMIDAPLNLNHHAHTPLDPQVREILIAAFEDADTNIHSGSPGAEAVRRKVDEARAQVARLAGAAAHDVVFTSGATEANNLAIRGLADDLTAKGRRRIVVGAGEHPSVHAAAREVAEFDTLQAPLTSQGVVDLDALVELITDQTGLVSVAAANHEMGVVQPITDIARLVRAGGALLHTDLAQAAGRIDIDLSDVDLASLSAHKIHGPLGIGALIIARPVRRRLKPLIVGGGQEAGLRSGTLPAPLCIAFGAACDLALRRRADDAKRLSGLRDHLLHRLSEATALTLHGRLNDRLPNNLNLSFDGVDGEALVLHVRDRLTIATGSACTSRALEPSHVLLAMGINRAQAEGAIRIGLGRDADIGQVDSAANHLIAAVLELRQLSGRRRA